jgi:preprotein translocase subunit SecG
MLYSILLAFMILVCVLMVVVILLQRSEGGALGIGSGPSGFMTARGAGNLLTRSTWILGALFFACAISLIVVGNIDRGASSITKLKVAPLAPSALKVVRPAPGAAGPAAAPPPSSKRDLGDLETAPAPPASGAPSPAKH